MSDSNELLIDTFIVVRDEVENLIDCLKKYPNKQDFYEEIKAWDRNSSYISRTRIEKASRLIYLNKTCYNGLFRVNSVGQFNVPFGHYKNPTICDESNLRACSVALQTVNIKVAEYSDLIDQISSRDFVYLDPPYEPVSKTASFNSYTAVKFDEVDQTRLFKFCQHLTRKRARFLLSNSSANWLRQLYKKDKRFHVGFVNAKRSINSDRRGRGPVREIVVRNYQ